MTDLLAVPLSGVRSVETFQYRLESLAAVVPMSVWTHKTESTVVLHHYHHLYHRPSQRYQR